jgi:hypothetical protein
MIGAPNAGSINSLRVLLNGFSALSFARPFGYLPLNLGRRLPFARVGPRVTFTVPAIYQMLPPRGQARFFSAALSPLPLDLYDVETWRRYKWSAAFDDASRRQELARLINKLGPDAARAESLRLAAERERFLGVALRRSAAFHAALDVECLPPPTLRFSFIGGDCIPTLDGAIVIDGVTPHTIFSVAEVRPGFRSGFRMDKWSRRKAAELIAAPGDGTITRHSLFGLPPSDKIGRPAVGVRTSMRSSIVWTALSCDSHNGLTHDQMTQDNLLTELLINR